MTPTPPSSDESSMPIEARHLLPLDHCLEEFGRERISTLLKENKLRPFSGLDGCHRLDRCEIIAAIVFPISVEMALRYIEHIPAVPIQEPLISVRRIHEILKSHFPGLSLHKLYDDAKGKRIPVEEFIREHRRYYKGRLSEVKAALEQQGVPIKNDVTIYRHTMNQFGFHTKTQRRSLFYRRK